jgi:DNA-binding XRE family transcriptional regulator
MSPLRDVLARDMRRLRAERGLSQEALANESGINRTYLSGVERSERNVSIDNIARICSGAQGQALDAAGRQRQMIGAAGRAWTCIRALMVMPARVDGGAGIGRRPFLGVKRT